MIFDNNMRRNVTILGTNSMRLMEGVHDGKNTCAKNTKRRANFLEKNVTCMEQSRPAKLGCLRKLWKESPKQGSTQGWPSLVAREYIWLSCSCHQSQLNRIVAWKLTSDHANVNYGATHFYWLRSNLNVCSFVPRCHQSRKICFRVQTLNQVYLAAETCVKICFVQTVGIQFCHLTDFSTATQSVVCGTSSIGFDMTWTCLLRLVFSSSAPDSPSDDCWNEKELHLLHDAQSEPLSSVHRLCVPECGVRLQLAASTTSIATLHRSHI
eukprot:g6444.t1